MKSVRVIVRGRVQGVGYRWFTRELAAERRVRGWVRNRTDGSVEAELHGTDHDVDAMVTSMRAGPAFSHVDSLTVTDVLDTGATGFEVRRSG